MIDNHFIVLEELKEDGKLYAKAMGDYLKFAPVSEEKLERLKISLGKSVAYTQMVLMVEEENDRVTLFDKRITIDVKFGTRSACNWWDVNIVNNFDIKIKGSIYLK